jgi:tetratricopeptide (TPR) repeat protein
VHPSYDIGVHYFLRQDYENALKAFRQVLNDLPTDGRAWSYYGICLAHQGRSQEAEAALSRAIGLIPANGEAWFHLGVARSLREEWRDAAVAYRRAVGLQPNDMVAWHRLGVALAESGDESGAAVAFERALVLSREVPPVPRSPPRGPRLEDDEADDDHLAEAGEREGGREAKSWLELALSLLSLGEEEEAIAAYERAYTLDPERAQKSLFRPMLRLLTAVAGGPEPDPDPEPDPETPTYGTDEFSEDPDDDRPEIG